MITEQTFNQTISARKIAFGIDNKEVKTAKEEYQVEFESRSPDAIGTTAYNFYKFQKDASLILRAETALTEAAELLVENFDTESFDIFTSRVNDLILQRAVVR